MLSLENSQNIVFLLLCAVIIFILFLFNLKNWKRNFWNYQSIIYLMAMIGCFLEAGAFALKGNINLIWLQYVTNILYFASISTIAIYTLLYCAHRLYDKLFKTKISKFLVSIPYYINLIALCFAPKFHIVFCINAKGEYHRTFTYFFQMIPLGYLVFTLIYTLYCYYKAETLMAKKNALSFSVLSIAPIIIAVLQIAMPNIGFDLMEYSILISLLINFISSQNNKITRDPLTRLLNKDFFNTIVYEWMDKKKPQGELFLLMCDIDNFKSINDCFGHIEGDNALVTFSKVLTEVCSKYNAISARVGGDEFAIIIETDSRKTVDMLINEINDMFSSISETKEYVLRTSIGCAKYRETDDVIDLFKAADRMLYKVKNEQKSLLKR